MIYEFVYLDKLEIYVLIAVVNEDAAAEIRENPSKHLAELIATKQINFMLYGKQFDFALVFLRDLPYEYYVIENYVLQRRSNINSFETGVIDARGIKAM